MKLMMITDDSENVEVRCDRCRHWEAPDSDGFAMCSGLDDRRGAFVSDVAGVSLYGNSELMTRAEHGCALFEAKP